MAFDGENENVAGESSLERAQDYVREHPIFGDEPKVDPPAEAPAGEAGKTGAEGAKPADEGKKDSAAAEGAAKPEGDRKPTDQAPPIDEKAVLEHPKYKELSDTAAGQKAILDELKPILTEGRYTIDGPATLKGTIEDAFMLYDIAAGKIKPGVLLDAMEKNAGWSEAQKQALYLELRDYLHGKGVDMKAPELDPRNPEHRAILDLRAQNETRSRQDAERQVEQTRLKATELLTSTVNGLAEKNGVAKEDWHDYALVVAAKVGADPKVVKQLEEGKTSELERLFTEHHNREIARQKRWLDAKVAKGDRREERLPRVPAGGTAPAPKPSDRPYGAREELRTSEGRTAAATKLWKSGAA